MMKPNALILFTRIPISGKTKTRLQNKLSKEECAEIHKCFLKDIYDEIINLKDYNIDIIICHNADGDLNILKEIFYDEKIYLEQKGNNLNEKIYNSINNVFSLGYNKVSLIGSDIPEISCKNILDCFNLLDNNDFVFGPSADGGYYLVGMNEYNDIMLKINSGNIDEILNSLNGFKYSIIEKKYDIDEYVDILELYSRINKYNINLKNTKEFLYKLI